MTCVTAAASVNNEYPGHLFVLDSNLTPVDTSPRSTRSGDDSRLHAANCAESELIETHIVKLLIGPVWLAVSEAAYAPSLDLDVACPMRPVTLPRFSLGVGCPRALACAAVCVERHILRLFREGNSPENFTDKIVSLGHGYASGDDVRVN